MDKNYRPADLQFHHQRPHQALKMMAPDAA
ncbi:hypothetical protein FHY09_001462 [Xanthomonas sp. 60]